jgi:hypothetical protein
MFYLPEVFTNINSIDFGTTQLGGKLGKSILPYVKYVAECINAELCNSEWHCRFCRITSLG